MHPHGNKHTFATPTEQDVVYCDTAHFPDKNSVIIGIVHKNEVTRISAKAKNGTVGELLGIVMSRKLYPGKLIVNDCKSVITMFRESREHRLRRMLGENAQIAFLLESINRGGVIWQKRRSDPATCLVDSLTRKELTRNMMWRLEQNGFTLREYGF